MAAAFVHCVSRGKEVLTDHLNVKHFLPCFHYLQGMLPPPRAKVNSTYGNGNSVSFFLLVSAHGGQSDQAAARAAGLVRALATLLGGTSTSRLVELRLAGERHLSHQVNHQE